MITNTKKTVKSLLEGVQEFYTKYQREISYDDGLCKCFDDFFKEANDTLTRLDNPTITIASVGTTSSGKSTILNGITGRNIAPSDIDEMSAGILTFTPSTTESKLIITESPEKFWPGKTYNNLSDIEMQNVIKHIFELYKTKKRHYSVCSAPQIEVKGDFMWNRHPKMFNLPEEVKFRFIDLPGLRKDKGDQKNLFVIQNVLQDVRPLSILAMDYSCLSQPETLEELLKELSDTIRNLGGSTESIIFLLNKVDLHNAGGATTLEQNIEKFRQRVIGKLSAELPKYNFENIKIIPFVGILYNNAQVSIGLQNHRYNDSLDGNSEYLSLIPRNCSNIFCNAERPIRAFFKSIDDDLIDKVNIDKKDITQLMKYSYSLSYADILIEELNRRIQDSFYEIVIYPAIFKLRIKFELLRGYLSNHISISRLGSLLSVHSLMFGMLDSQIKILGTTEENNTEFIDKINSSISSIENTPIEFNKYYSNLRSKYSCQLNSEYQDISKLDLEKLLLNDNNNNLSELLLQSIDNNRELYNRIYDEIRRKHDLINEYVKLKELLSNNIIDGEIKTKFRHTIRANNEALKILTEYSDVCKTNLSNASIISTARVNANKSLKLISHKGIEALYTENFKMLERIKSSIEFDLLTPFKKVYPISDYNEKSLENDYKKSSVIKELSIMNLVDMFSIFRTQFNDWMYNNKTADEYTIYSSSTKPNPNNYSSYTRKYEMLNLRIRTAISDFMGYKVQIEHKSFIEKLINILEADTESIIEEINKSGFGVDIASIVNLLTIENRYTPKIPEELFTFAVPQTGGSTTETKYGSTGGCCPDYYSYDVTTYTIKYPTIDGLYKNWTQGIAASERDFWKIIVDWVSSVINLQENSIETAIKEISDNVTSTIIKQKQNLETGAEKKMRLIDEMEDRFAKEVLKYNNNLKQNPDEC